MPTLRLNESTRQTIPVGQALTIIAPPGSSVYVEGEQDLFPVGTVSGTTQVFGPYAVTEIVHITCTAGAGMYGIAKAVASVNGAGSPVIASRVGSCATPIATLTLSGSAGVFVLPIVPTLPAGRIPPHSRVWFDFRFRRGPSALGSMLVNVRLGTAGNATDGAVFSGTMAATVSADFRLLTSAEFSSDPTRYTTGLWQAFNTAGVNIGVDRTARVDTSAAMFVSADVSGGTSGDTLYLISYAVRLEV